LFCVKYACIFAKTKAIKTITISIDEYNALTSLVKMMAEKVGQLEKENALLKKDIELLKNSRNSNTSSTPPSQDYGRIGKSKSLRNSTGKKSGGQFGHEGNNLQVKEIPDDIIEYRPSFCQECGEEFSQQDFQFVTKKQEVVLPPIVPRFVEHQSFSCKCNKCGSTTISSLPEYLKAGIQYGDNLKALVVYLSAYQYLPYNRIVAFLKDFLNTPISEGTIDNILKECTQKARPAYEVIQQKIQNSLVVGGDETGIKINGKKGWLFTFQNEKLTFLSASMSRGFQSISSLFGCGFPNSTYVSDSLAAQLKILSKEKQLCTSHLLRELKNFIDVFDCRFSKELQDLIKDAIELKHRISEDEYHKHKNKTAFFLFKLDKLLEPEHKDKHKKVYAFIKRLRKQRNAIFSFLKYPDVPPDNNGSERAIRNAKVKMKVSGQFRTLQGAESFAILRSIIDTAKKNSQNVFDALSLVAKMN